MAATPPSSGTRWIPGFLAAGLIGASFIDGAAHAAEGRDVLRIHAGIARPSDRLLRDLYGVMPSLGVEAVVRDLGWSEVALGGSIRWAGGDPQAGPFVDRAASGWLSVPVHLSMSTMPGREGLVPSARVGLIGQWSREDFDVEVGGETLARSVDQIRPGLLAGVGLGGRGRIPWQIGVSWEWVPGHRLAFAGSHTRREEDMDLGSLTLSLKAGLP